MKKRIEYVGSLTKTGEYIPKCTLTEKGMLFSTPISTNKIVIGKKHLVVGVGWIHTPTRIIEAEPIFSETTIG